MTLLKASADKFFAAHPDRKRNEYFGHHATPAGYAQQFIAWLASMHGEHTTEPNHMLTRLDLESIFSCAEQASGEEPETMEFRGRYLEVVPDSRIVWTNEEGDDEPSVTTVTLEERDDKTYLVLTEVYPTKEALDEAGTGAQDALRETFAQLDEVLVTLAG